LRDIQQHTHGSEHFLQGSVPGLYQSLHTHWLVIELRWVLGLTHKRDHSWDSITLGLETVALLQALQSQASLGKFGSLRSGWEQSHMSGELHTDPSGQFSANE
jgi:hypothetical protein